MGNILIVGGSRGIGYSTVKLLSDKHNVFVASRTNENLSVDWISPETSA